MIPTIALMFVLAATEVPQLEKVTENTVKLKEGAVAPTASLDELAWLAGHWTGDGLGGQTEETWGAPSGGVMVGAFKLVKEGKPVFYEFMTLGPTENGLAMRLKHFNPDMKGWEEKEKFVEFRYIGAEGNVHRFSGLTFRRDSDDALTIFLALRQKSGEVKEMEFRMKRMR